MSTWDKLLSLIKPYIPILLLSLFGSILQSAGTTLITLLVKRVVDNVFILKEEGEAVILTLAFLGSAILMQLGYFLATFTVIYVSEKIIKELREEIYEKLLYTPFNFFLKTSSGDLISRIVSDLESFKQVFSEYIPKLIREPFVALALFGVLIYRDWLLTLFILLFFPVMYLFTKYFSEKKKKYLKKQRENVSLLTEILSESFRGIENIKLYLSEERFIKHFKEFSEKFFQSSVKINFYVISNTVINYIFGYAVVSLLLLAGSIRILKGDISPGDFISFLTALFMIQKPIMEVQKAIMNLKGTAPLFDRIFMLLKLSKEKGGSKEFHKFTNEISFRDIKVRINGKEILTGITFTVKKGDKVGIRGHTGSGKSTFIRILPRLIDYEGNVFIDGTELREFSLSSLRKRIGFSTQEVFLFKGTVRDNLLIAKEDASEEEMINALKLAKCDFILNSPYGLEYPIEERGINLSGGEKQRLALARIFLKNPEIVILDEATSALDPLTEEEVLRNLFTFFKDKTMFVVAHRESNLIFCNKIVEFENGKLKSITT